MAGIYIHIPFCKKRCIYCDFYSTTQSAMKEIYMDALGEELKIRKDYIQGEKIKTIYLGGGTPTQISFDKLNTLFKIIYSEFIVVSEAEITIEANPDDLTLEYISSLRNLPFNRISIGIQTFQERILKIINRRHTARQAIKAYEDCRNAGFDNISIDLIYGLPGESLTDWKEDVEKAIALKPEHLSAYSLIYEEGTELWNLREKHAIEEADESLSLRMFNYLIDKMNAAGYEHYEISNFCQPGKYSKHNSSYWTGEKYLGCGPSAHSYNGKTRQWNVASLNKYMKGIKERTPIFELETLNEAMRYNDYIITRLRTSWGMNLDKLMEIFGRKFYDYCLKMARNHIEQGTLEIKDGIMKLTRKGIFISDGIMSDLLWVDD